MKPSDVQKMKAQEVREKTDAELERLGTHLEEEIFRLRFRKGAGQLKQVSNIRAARRTLARVKTIVRERALASAKGGA